MFEGIQQMYNSLWKSLIRPEKDEYEMSDLGPSSFYMNGVLIKRKDVQLKNKRNLNIKCSHYYPITYDNQKTPCVIYLHGNSGSRIDSLYLIDYLLPKHISLFSFDFSACGKSEGEYISFCLHEQDDTEIAIQYLIEQNLTSEIILWGRSMGASTAMYFSTHKNVHGLILDSPFSSLEEAIIDNCNQNKLIPNFTINYIYNWLREKIQAEGGFDISQLRPIDQLNNSPAENQSIPIFFLSAKNDKLILPKHSEKLYQACNNNVKYLKLIEGGHNTFRSKSTNKEIMYFIEKCIESNKIKFTQNQALKNISNNFSSNNEIQLSQIEDLYQYLYQENYILQINDENQKDQDIQISKSKQLSLEKSGFRPSVKPNFQQISSIIGDSNSEIEFNKKKINFDSKQTSIQELTIEQINQQLLSSRYSSFFSPRYSNQLQQIQQEEEQEETNESFQKNYQSNQQQCQKSSQKINNIFQIRENKKNNNLNHYQNNIKPKNN